MTNKFIQENFNIKNLNLKKFKYLKNKKLFFTSKFKFDWIEKKQNTFLKNNLKKI